MLIDIDEKDLKKLDQYGINYIKYDLNTAFTESEANYLIKMAVDMVNKEMTPEIKSKLFNDLVNDMIDKDIIDEDYTFDILKERLKKNGLL